MCEKTKRKIDIATLIYKVFLIIMIIAQIYSLFFMALPIILMIGNSILGMYLIFRYYMLSRMQKRAIVLDFTLTEFLNERSSSRDCSDSLSCPRCSRRDWVN